MRKKCYYNKFRTSKDVASSPYIHLSKINFSSVCSFKKTLFNHKWLLKVASLAVQALTSLHSCDEGTLRPCQNHHKSPKSQLIIMQKQSHFYHYQCVHFVRKESLKRKKSSWMTPISKLPTRNPF